MEDEITQEAFHVLKIPYRSLITGSSSVGRGSQLEKLGEEQTGSRKGHSDKEEECCISTTKTKNYL